MNKRHILSFSVHCRNECGQQNGLLYISNLNFSWVACSCTKFKVGWYLFIIRRKRNRHMKYILILLHEQLNYVEIKKNIFTVINPFLNSVLRLFLIDVVGQPRRWFYSCEKLHVPLFLLLDPSIFLLSNKKNNNF